MCGGDHDGTGRRRGATVVMALAALVSLAAVAPAADAKKKKKKAGSATTKSAFTAFTAGTAVSGTPTCKGKSHATGGGYAVAPNFAPPSTGLRTLPLSSSPSGSKRWTGSSAAFTVPSASGSFTSFVRCESNNQGSIALRASSSSTYQSGEYKNLVFNCPKGTHVIAGGFAGDGPANLASPATFRILQLGSRRTGSRQWTVSAFNRNGGPPATVTGHVVCERNAKGDRVSEVSSVAQVVNDSRVAIDPTCPKGKHVVSGGFFLSIGATIVPLASVDEFQPVGKRGWHVGLFEFPGAALPPEGSQLTGYAYCKAG